MDKDIIHVLAKEYAEFTDGSPANITAIAEDIIYFLLRRYDLIWKEDIKRIKQFHENQFKNSTKGGKQWFFYKGSINTINLLFPKEVKQ